MAGKSPAQLASHEELLARACNRTTCCSYACCWTTGYSYACCRAIGYPYKAHNMHHHSLWPQYSVKSARNTTYRSEGSGLKKKRQNEVLSLPSIHMINKVGLSCSKQSWYLSEGIYKWSLKKYTRMIITWAPSQYKDRLIYVWRFPC